MTGLAGRNPSSTWAVGAGRFAGGSACRAGPTEPESNSPTGPPDAVVATPPPYAPPGRAFRRAGVAAPPRSASCLDALLVLPLLLARQQCAQFGPGGEGDQRRVPLGHLARPVPDPASTCRASSRSLSTTGTRSTSYSTEGKTPSTRVFSARRYPSAASCACTASSVTRARRPTQVFQLCGRDSSTSSRSPSRTGSPVRPSGSVGLAMPSASASSPRCGQFGEGSGPDQMREVGGAGDLELRGVPGQQVEPGGQRRAEPFGHGALLRWSSSRRGLTLMR